MGKSSNLSWVKSNFKDQLAAQRRKYSRKLRLARAAEKRTKRAKRKQQSRERYEKNGRLLGFGRRTRSRYVSTNVNPVRSLSRQLRRSPSRESAKGAAITQMMLGEQLLEHKRGRRHLISRVIFPKRKHILNTGLA